MCLEKTSYPKIISPAPPSFISKHWDKVVAFSFWTLAVGGYWWYATTYDLSPLAVIKMIFMDLLLDGWYGVIIFVLFFGLQPLIFFPSFLMGVLGGYLYGPVFGSMYALLGGTLAAIVTYTVGRYFSLNSLTTEQAGGKLYHYTERLRRNSFETILTIHLLFLPYDLTNYFAGFLRIPWKPFILATILGSLPGTISFVLLGAAIEGDFTVENVSINPWTLVASMAMLAISLSLSHYVRRHQAGK